jgi:hypothetical protein
MFKAMLEEQDENECTKESIKLSFLRQIEWRTKYKKNKSRRER